MTNILTRTEASNVLRCDIADPEMIDLLPLVDSYIINATGHDWTSDGTILPMAKRAAGLLLTMWHEDPGMLAQRNAPLSFGLNAALAQLEAIASSYMEFMGVTGAGACTLLGARMGDTVNTLTGLIVYSGDQKAKFEAVITVDDQIQQLSNADLSKSWFRVYLVPVGHL